VGRRGHRTCCPHTERSLAAASRQHRARPRPPTIFQDFDYVSAGRKLTVTRSRMNRSPRTLSNDTTSAAFLSSVQRGGGGGGGERRSVPPSAQNRPAAVGPRSFDNATAPATAVGRATAKQIHGSRRAPRQGKRPPPDRCELLDHLDQTPVNGRRRGHDQSLRRIWRWRVSVHQQVRQQRT